MNSIQYNYIDLQSIREDTFGDVEILRMIIALFIEGIDEYVEILNNELANQNWQELFKATHKIKPNISMFGITKLVSTILELESNFKNEQNLNDVDALVNYSIPIFNQVKIELQTELNLMPNE